MKPAFILFRGFILTYKLVVGSLLIFSSFLTADAQHSVARKWNEVLLESIRNDLARPTIHARNLFHVSAAMYDAWAVYDNTASPYFLGQSVHGFYVPFERFPAPADIEKAREEAISYAAYRLLKHRFQFSPGFEDSSRLIDSLFHALGYDPNNESQNYLGGSPAALGNYIAAQVREYGFQDGANETDFYSNQFYEPINEALNPEDTGNYSIKDPNRWQPLLFESFIDQSGNQSFDVIPAFLSPEWGFVQPFALGAADVSIKYRDGNEYWIYHDPGPPAYFDLTNPESSEEYVWNHSLVAIWSSHLDPSDNVRLDISPGAIGNQDVGTFPTDLGGLHDFYRLLQGGDYSSGWDVNPVTGTSYESQWVPRGDYTRVLAEFWADGPDSETPPGHWFTILNYVNDHPELVREFESQGNEMDKLEWDIKGYFLLGGAMHDAAISAWSVKGYYDYVRPVSAIRFLAGLGQSTDEDLPNFHQNGIQLKEGFIELVKENDPLAGAQNENVGKIKLYAWRGPAYIHNPATDEAGVGWILAENWWPYQRPTFVTPPFAGYVSGHSTYSRTAAEILTRFTGSAFFPGGLGEFVAKKDEFLVFEEGPSVDVVLQWATYRDASDQCSLSRIWGGIHPPVDDMPGRLIGNKIAAAAFEKAKSYFGGKVMSTKELTKNYVIPNPLEPSQPVILNFPFRQVVLYDLQGKVEGLYERDQFIKAPSKEGVYIMKFITDQGIHSHKIIIE